MSADAFQTKYASVMESMLQSAIAETTKLFETMVDELKAEISRIKKENEDLKERCCQFDSARSPPTVYSRESEPPPGRSDRSDKRDTAIQCGELQCPVTHHKLIHRPLYNLMIMLSLFKLGIQNRRETILPYATLANGGV